MLPKLPKEFPEDPLAPQPGAKLDEEQKSKIKEAQEHRQEAWHECWAEVEARFLPAEKSGDDEVMHRLWTNATTSWLKTATQVRHTNYKDAAQRASQAKFVPKQAVSIDNKETGQETSQKERRLRNLEQRLWEMKRQSEKNRKASEAGRVISQTAQQQVRNLWANIIKAKKGSRELPGCSARSRVGPGTHTDRRSPAKDGRGHQHAQYQTKARY